MIDLSGLTFCYAVRAFLAPAQEHYDWHWIMAAEMQLIFQMSVQNKERCSSWPITGLPGCASQSSMGSHSSHKMPLNDSPKMAWRKCAGLSAHGGQLQRAVSLWSDI